MFHAPTGTGVRSGVVPGADWDRRPSGRRSPSHVISFAHFYPPIVWNRMPYNSKHPFAPNPLLPGNQSYLDPYAAVEVRRNRLPHWQQGHKFIFVTWRLGDSLPEAKLVQWREERALWLKNNPRPWNSKTARRYHDRFLQRIEDWLDQGSGSCILKDPALARIVADALRYFDGQRYELSSFVVMPNHVHVLFRPLGRHRLGNILSCWKGFTGHQIRKKTGTSGKLWQKDYWDRLIRNPEHYLNCLEYIRENPGRAGLREGEFVLFERGGGGEVGG